MEGQIVLNRSFENAAQDLLKFIEEIANRSYHIHQMLHVGATLCHKIEQIKEKHEKEGLFGVMYFAIVTKTKDFETELLGLRNVQNLNSSGVLANEIGFIYVITSSGFSLEINDSSTNLLPEIKSYMKKLFLENPNYFDNNLNYFLKYSQPPQKCLILDKGHLKSKHFKLLEENCRKSELFVENGTTEDVLMTWKKLVSKKKKGFMYYSVSDGKKANESRYSYFVSSEPVVEYSKEYYNVLRNYYSLMRLCEVGVDEFVGEVFKELKEDELNGICFNKNLEVGDMKRGNYLQARDQDMQNEMEKHVNYASSSASNAMSFNEEISSKSYSFRNRKKTSRNFKDLNITENEEEKPQIIAKRKFIDVDSRSVDNGSETTSISKKSKNECLDDVSEDENYSVENQSQSDQKVEEGEQLFKKSLNLMKMNSQDRNPRKALELLEKACFLGYTKARALLGISFLEKDKIPQEKYENNEKFRERIGLTMLQDAFNEKNLLALGYASLHGCFEERNLNAALKYGEEAVELTNDCIDQWFLGECYYQIGRYIEAFKYFEMAADNGFTIAMLEVGLCNFLGIGCQKNEAEAEKYFQAAADGGNSLAMERLVACLQDMERRNFANEVRYMKKGLEFGNFDLIGMLAKCYEEGSNGVKQNCVEAVKLYFDLYNRGVSSASWDIGRCYMYGRGVPIDILLAEKWFNIDQDYSSQEKLAIELISDAKKSAEKYGISIETIKNPKLLNLNDFKNEKERMYYESLALMDISEEKNNYELSLQKLQEAAKGKKSIGYIKAKSLLGAYYLSQYDPRLYKKGVKLILEASEMNDPFAIGYVHLFGITVEEDLTKAEEYAIIAAKAGDCNGIWLLGKCIEQSCQRNKAVVTPRKKRVHNEKVHLFLIAAMGGSAYFGLHSLGLSYKNGKGINKDVFEGVRLLKHVAENCNNADSMYDLGMCFKNSIAVRVMRDKAIKAADWFEKSAEKGNSEAMYQIGMCYEKGNGRTKDHVKASRWYKKCSWFTGDDNFKDKIKVAIRRVNDATETNYEDLVKKKE